MMRGVICIISYLYCAPWYYSDQIMMAQSLRLRRTRARHQWWYNSNVSDYVKGFHNPHESFSSLASDTLRLKLPLKFVFWGVCMGPAPPKRVFGLVTMYHIIALIWIRR
jgi:hypothetical protein